MQKIGFKICMCRALYILSVRLLLVTQFSTLSKTEESIASKGKCCYTELINLLEKVLLMYLFIH